jgi:hypothetical protein
VIGYPSNVTLKDQSSRKHFLYDILRDIHTLSQCHAAVCGFSSNVCIDTHSVFDHIQTKNNPTLFLIMWLQVCAIIQEIFATKHFDFNSRVLSTEYGQIVHVLFVESLFAHGCQLNLKGASSQNNVHLTFLHTVV